MFNDFLFTWLNVNNLTAIQADRGAQRYTYQKSDPVENRLQLIICVDSCFIFYEFLSAVD